ncbi:Zeaxanthin glucosyltransferase [Pseudomonas fluorescens]|uniref:glycosyltransferase n=1 Tax=Pseudomonas fluorescens TaxID=294 RepID=UPI00125660B3|nr:glycosyltransferase [Pseudomonas fluorescens]CAG8863328.1 Zeaxanthin glucosyltransferase [Pseudomonas fluorescens]
MSHIGVVAPPYYSHFQALQALTVELLKRGHRITFFHQADAARWLTDSRVGFQAVGARSHPPGSLETVLRQAASPGSPWGLRRVIGQMAATTAMLCRELPPVLTALDVDILLCDQMEGAGALVAQSMNLPFISVACALPINREAGLPLPVMPFTYRPDPRSQQLYQGSARVHDWLMAPLGRALDDAARALDVPPPGALHGCLSPLAQISQTLPGFDFPRRQPPGNFHAVGPLRGPRNEDAGPWPIDPKRPFIFASLGTLQGERRGMFEQIATACRRLGAQLLVAHCGKLGRAHERRLVERGATWVTDFAPQQWALEQADAVVTHGGLNTVMDAIAARTPLLVMPIAFDQHGVAARVSHHKLGVKLHRWARAPRIAEALEGLLTKRAPALDALAAELQQAGGAPKAADIVEAVLGMRDR